MSGSDLRSLERRMTALETQNRQLRRGLALAVTAALALPVLAAFTPLGQLQDPVDAPQAAVPEVVVPEVVEELRARRLVLVDERGEERVVAGVDAKNTARLTIHDDAGTERVRIGVDARAAFALLRDEQGRKRVGMACDAFPHLMLLDSHQKQRIHASVGITEAPSLLFLNQRGDFTLGMGLDADGAVWRRPAAQGAGDAVEPEGSAVPPANDDRRQPGEPEAGSSSGKR